MTDEIDWEPCAADDCNGVRLPTGDSCWAHAANSDVNMALKRLSEDGRLDVRGVPISAELLSSLLAAAPQDEHGHAILSDAQCHQAVFHGEAETEFGFVRVGFDGVTFFGESDFRGATFYGDAGFYGATFHGVEFSKARFYGFAEFGGVTFHSDAEFGEAIFYDDAVFGSVSLHGVYFQDGAEFGKVTLPGAAFHGEARFGKATFHGHANFNLATFHGDAWFFEADFRDYTSFDGVTFHRATTFYGVTSLGYIEFNWATFQNARQLGPMLIRRGGLVMDDAVFHERIRIEVSTTGVCCRNTQFLNGVELRVRWAEIVLDGTDFAAPSILSGGPAIPLPWEGRWARALQRLHRSRGCRSGPRLASLCRADVAGLTVAHLDLSACRFAGAHHLDQLGIEECNFAPTPKGWRWTSRQTIAEEHQWRAARPHGADASGWYQIAQQQTRFWDGDRLPAPLTPARIASIYRALRKGREDNKDEPGAADFYYGEMEMRRLDPTKPTGERLVLFLYWLFSGYGLRASRAFVWLLGVLVMATVVLAALGLKQPAIAAHWSFPARLGTAALVAVEGAVFRASEQQLTYLGRLTQAVLRFAGPVLLGLAILSVRGRVKR